MRPLDMVMEDWQCGLRFDWLLEKVFETFQDDASQRKPYQNAFFQLSKELVS